MPDKKNNEMPVEEIPDIYDRRTLNQMYREIPLKDTTSRLLRKYFAAMANLYGIIPLPEAYKIAKHFSPRSFSEEEFFDFAEIARHEDGNYGVLGAENLYTDGRPSAPHDREIVNLDLMESVRTDKIAYYDTKEFQRGKAYYIPSTKEEFLAYTDEFYIEATPEYTAFDRFLRARYAPKKNIIGVDFAVKMMFVLIRIDVDMDTLMDKFAFYGFKLQGGDDIRRFGELYQNYVNHARLFSNCGYTPNELQAMKPPEYYKNATISIGENMRAMLENGELDIYDLRRSIMEQEFPNERMRDSLLEQIDEIMAGRSPSAKSKKIGRNEPCPCGSGKKYKKCCGR